MSDIITTIQNSLNQSNCHLSYLKTKSRGWWTPLPSAHPLNANREIVITTDHTLVTFGAVTGCFAKAVNFEESQLLLSTNFGHTYVGTNLKVSISGVNTLSGTVSLIFAL